MIRYQEKSYLLHPPLLGFFAVAAVILLAISLPNFKAYPRETCIQFSLFMVFAIIILSFGQLVLTVTTTYLMVSFGWLRWVKKEILLEDILDKEIVEFRPIMQFGGWGLRSGNFRGERTNCLTISGKRGLLLTLKNPVRSCLLKSNKLIVGSSDPSTLYQALSC